MSIDFMNPRAVSVRATSDWRDLPERGVGIVYMAGLANVIADAGALVDFVEVEPQQHWLRGRGRDDRFRLDGPVFDAIKALGKPCIVHSVGCPLGGTDSTLDEQADALRASIERLDPAWVSEHLSFNRFTHGGAQHHANFLLPPLPCAASRDMAVQRIGALRAALAKPIAFENGVNYLRPMAGEWSDGRFVREVAEHADCAILLDLHNAWTNARNGRQPLAAFLDELPLERVVELHLAGGEWLDGYWLDAHSGLVQPELLALAAELVPRLPSLRAITFEMMDEALAGGACDAAGIRRQLETMQHIWAHRGSGPHRATPRRKPGASSAPEPEPSPSEWESAVGLLATGLEAAADGSIDAEWRCRLAADPGLGVLRTLVEAVRAGAVVDLLRLGTRLIVLARGRGALIELLATYWRQASAQPLATDEAIAFGEYLLAQKLGIHGLDDLLRLEIAATRVLADQQPAVLELADDPTATIEALQRQRLPQPRTTPRPITLELTP